MYTYLIYDKSSKLFKIGKSKAPLERIRYILTGNPNATLLFYTGKYTEKYLHDKYSEFKVHGEWYKLKIEHLREIMGDSSNVPKTFFYRSTISKIKSKTYTESKSLTISINYDFEYYIENMPEYQFAKKKLFNVKRGNEVKKVLKGYTVGYNLRGKFYSLARIKKMIKPIEKINCPF